MILQCSHIDKAFSTDVILSDISFHINEHEKAAIVGANGSGKSTLLKIITGHLSADNGEVILSAARLSATWHRTRNTLPNTASTMKCVMPNRRSYS